MTRLSASGFDLTPPDPTTLEQRAAALTPEERHILLHQGTERPFCGGFLDNKSHGIYQCKLCDLPLFRAEHKFNSGTGWPSFFDSLDADHVRTVEDYSHGMRRSEIRCGRCDAHLGHVFPDGPAPTGLRYCLNSASLQFVPE
ncbi:MAG: peptide-methionine (R)-S-oxide reductase MsrB [Alcanivoracaceae bacterium]